MNLYDHVACTSAKLCIVMGLSQKGIYKSIIDQIL